MLLAVAVTSSGATPPAPRAPTTSDTLLRLAGLSDSLPGTFVGVVNDIIAGELRPRRVEYHAPSTAVLHDVVVFAPGNRAVAKVKRLQADLALRPLLSGDIVIKTLSVDEPKLLLEMRNGKLNLLEAFAPKKPKASSDDNKPPPDITIRIDRFAFSDGDMRFRDGENVTITATDADGHGRVEIHLRDTDVVVEVNDISVAQGALKLKPMDVSLHHAYVDQLRLHDNVIDLTGVRATVIDAPVTLAGRVGLLNGGNLQLRGEASTTKNTWPARLAPPPFALPAADVDFKVTGPFKNPMVHLDVKAGAFAAYDYRIHDVRAKVRVNKDKVLLDDVVARLAAPTQKTKTWAGKLKVSGDLRIADLVLAAKVGVVDVPLAAALAPAKLDPRPEGLLNGDVRLLGAVDGKHPLRVEAKVNAKRPRAFSLDFGRRLDVDALLSVDPNVLQVRSVKVRSTNAWTATAQGPVSLKDKSLALRVAADVQRPEVFVEGLPAELVLGPTTFNGQVRGPFDGVVVDGNAVVDRVTAWGNPMQALAAKVRVTTSEVRLTELSGTVLGGRLGGEVRVDLKRKSLPLQVTATVVGGRLQAIRTPDGKDPGVKGGAAVTAVVSGPAKTPSVQVSLRATDVEVQNEKLGVITAQLAMNTAHTVALQLTKDDLVVERLRVDSDMLQASATDIVLRTKASTLQGRVLLHALQLAEVQNAKSANLEGVVRGVFDLHGPVAEPQVVGDLDVRDLAVDGTSLGGGPLDVFLNPTLQNGVVVDGQLVQASSHLTGGVGTLQLRAAYAVSSEQVHARLRVSDMELLPWTQKLEPDISAIDGTAAGTVVVTGKVGALDATFQAQVPDVTLMPPPTTKAAKTTIEDMALFTARGAVRVQGKLDKGLLRASVCAFPTTKQVAVRGPNCSLGERIWADVKGPVDQTTGSFHLGVDVGVTEDSLPAYVRALQKSKTQASVGLSGQLVVRRGKEKGAKVVTQGNFTLLEQQLAADRAPEATLKVPSRIRLHPDSTVELVTPLRYQVGDSDVVIQGKFGTKELHAEVDGLIGLATLTLLPETFSSGTGAATAHLKINGPYNAPRLDGVLQPQKGASVTPRALRQAVVFERGKLLFSSSDEGALKQTIRSDGLTVALDDGTATLDGTLLANLDGQDGRAFFVEKWDVILVGNGLSYQSGTTSVETAVDLSLRGPYKKPVLKGRIEVTDGSVREKFAMKNFVIEHAPGEASKPLVDTLAAVSLENLEFDVGVDVRSFHVEADVASFLLEADLTGGIRLEDSAQVYTVLGAIEASRGSFQFPYADFELTQTRVEFPRGSAGIEPRIYLLANAELDPARTGFEAETACALELAGDTERLRLSLEAADAERSLTDTELLKFILFGFPLAQAGDADPDAAVRAVSGELTAAFTREVEDAIARELGANLEWNVFAETDRVATGVKYQIGQRVEFESELGVGFEGNNDTQARVRLLVFDHLPAPLPFRELAFGAEVKTSTSGASASNAQAASGNLRLSLRFFEQ